MRRIPLLLSAPVATAHEATHAAAAAAFGHSADLVVSFDDAEAVAAVDLEDAGRVAATVACLAPTILGHALALVVAVWWLLEGGTLPATGVGWAKLSLAAIVWGLYTAPSRGDVGAARRHARGGDRR